MVETAFNAGNYWQARFDQEKKRADDNLHLASCAATEITGLRDRLSLTHAELERVELERDTYGSLLRALREEFDGLALLASVKPVEAYESAFRKLVAEIDETLQGVSAETPLEPGERHD